MGSQTFKVFVDSEIGSLKRVMIHSPDNGLGKVVPSKAQDWLFEDIIQLGSMRSKEYDLYLKVLLYFLDPGKILGRLKSINDPLSKRSFFKPEHPDFYRSAYVIEFQHLLTEILLKAKIKDQLVAAVCAHEKCSWETQRSLLEYNATQLASTLISGSMAGGAMIFPPVPNLIFTRDIGIVIGDHILMNRAASVARSRESLLGKYIFFNHPLFSAHTGRIIELSDSIHYFLLPEGENDFKKTTLEGGDIMMIAPRHLLIGISERTSAYAANQTIKAVFKRNLVDKVSVLKIPKRRAFMHIDTIFTQVRRDCWVMLGSLGRRGDHVQHEGVFESLMESKPADQLKILQFLKGREDAPREFNFLEDLLEDISQNDLNVQSTVHFIYSGGSEFPYDAREQWTDACNLLAIKEGVIIGYDRNERTAESFMGAGFEVINAEELIDRLENSEIEASAVKNTLILLPSAELSRARGGSHCMSLPLERLPFQP